MRLKTYLTETKITGTSFASLNGMVVRPFAIWLASCLDVVPRIAYNSLGFRLGRFKRSYYYGKRLSHLIESTYPYNPTYIAIVKGDADEWEWNGEEGIEYFIDPLAYTDRARVIGVYNVTTGKRI